MKYHFGLQQFNHRTRNFKNKNVEVEAKGYTEAKAIIDRDYPNWQVASFWPINPPKRVRTLVRSPHGYLTVQYS